MPSDSGGLIGESPALGIDHFVGQDQVVAGQGGIQRPGEAGGDDPGGSMAGR